MTIGTATKLWALDGARFTVDRSIMVVGGTGSETIPVPAFLIEHPRGLVLFDTGISPQAVNDPEGTYGDLAAHLGLDYTPELLLDAQLATIGFRPSDITHVVLSHAHFDHTGGLSLFPEAKCYVGAADLPYAYWPLPAAAPFFRTADLEPTRAFDWRPLHGDHDLFGDGSIQVLSLPGHTPGNSSLLVRLPSRSFVLTGDTVHVHEALDGDLPMPSDWSTLDAVRSVRRMKQVAEANDATIWVAHDLADFEKYRGTGEALV